MSPSDPISSAIALTPAGLPSWATTLAAVGILAAAALLSNLIVKRVILRLALRLLPVDGPTPAPIVARLANIVPAIVVSQGVAAIPQLPTELAIVTRNVASAFIILTAALAISAGLDLVNALYQRRPGAANRPIKGYLQVLKIVLAAGTAIMIIATLMNQSPLLLISGLGAMAAVLMLVFKDTILSLVASVQLTSNDMIRVGDWIEMPQLNADGDVIDIALHTVKVQNWDKTITTIPTHRLIVESFKNWRGMSESGGRRIKRALLIDQASVEFLSPEAEAAAQRFTLLDGYLGDKHADLRCWNIRLGERAADVVNTRRLTNIGTFRAYVLAYLRAHPKLAQDMTLLVRQLAPTPSGLPIEIYCFTRTTGWADYESIQADIFDHLLAILPEFGLRLFQAPSGQDVARLIAA